MTVEEECWYVVAEVGLEQITDHGAGAEGGGTTRRRGSTDQVIYHLDCGMSHGGGSLKRGCPPPPSKRWDAPRPSSTASMPRVICISSITYFLLEDGCGCVNSSYAEVECNA
jgi:hypothetical protein